MKIWHRKSVRGTIAAACLAAIGGVAAAVPAQAEELRIAIGLTGDNGLVRGMQKFADNVAANTDGAYTGKVFPNSLLNFAEAMTGVRDGIADVAFVVPAYNRAEFPNSNLVVDMATASTDPVVMTGAANEFMFSCAACLKEYANQNQVFLGLTSIGPYYLMSKPKVATLDDFKAKKFRGFGPFGRWVETMGATPVVVSANDVYESISQGQLDGNTHTMDVLKSLSIGEVTDYVLDAPIGLYIGNSLFNLNRDVWEDLTPEQKKQFLLAAGDAHGFTTVEYLAENQRYLKDPSLVGVELVQPSPEVAEASAAFRKQDLETVAALNRDKYQIADAEDQVARMLSLVAKWEKLAAGIDKSDPKAVGDLYNQEIFSKVDPASLD